MLGSSKSALHTGIIDSLPICLSFFFMFTSLGANCRIADLSEINSVLMTLLVFAAPLQIVLLYALKHQHGGLIYFACITLVVNFRFVLNSVAITPHIGQFKWYKLVLAMFMFSASTFTVAYTKYKTSELKASDNLDYFWGVAIPSFVVANLATILGYYCIKNINGSHLWLIFTIVLPLHFAALTAKRYPNIFAINAAITGFILTPFLAGHSGFISVLAALIVGAIMVCYESKSNE